LFCQHDGDWREFLQLAVPPTLDCFRVSDDSVDKHCLLGLVYDLLYECFALGLCIVYDLFDEPSCSHPIDGIQY
jgi:hypothetical protein